MWTHDVDAQFVALELYQTYGVGVCDRSKTWFFNNDTGLMDGTSWEEPSLESALKQQSIHIQHQVDRQDFFSITPLLFQHYGKGWTSPPYSLSNCSEPLDQSLHQRTFDLVQQRIHKREEGKFIEADAIRKELWKTYNIGINDRLNLYSVGGKFPKKDIS